MIKQRKKTYFIISLWNCYWNMLLQIKQEHLASLLTKQIGFNILYTPFLFITNQFISKQSSHVKLLMLKQARRNQGTEGRIDRNYYFLR